MNYNDYRNATEHNLRPSEYVGLTARETTEQADSHDSYVYSEVIDYIDNYFDYKLAIKHDLIANLISREAFLPIIPTFVMASMTSFIEQDKQRLIFYLEVKNKELIDTVCRDYRINDNINARAKEKTTSTKIQNAITEFLENRDEEPRLRTSPRSILMINGGKRKKTTRRKRINRRKKTTRRKKNNETTKQRKKEGKK